MAISRWCRAAQRPASDASQARLENLQKDAARQSGMLALLDRRNRMLHELLCKERGFEEMNLPDIALIDLGADPQAQISKCIIANSPNDSAEAGTEATASPASESQHTEGSEDLTEGVAPNIKGI
eukprot:scaffold636611_cov51-Prasinocladus_malaysianus.AAC.1